MAAGLWQAQFRHDRPPIERIIAQTERRGLCGEPVVANEKMSAHMDDDAAQEGSGTLRWPIVDSRSTFGEIAAKRPRDHKDRLGLHSK
jgi:hypothetical protein